VTLTIGISSAATAKYMEMYESAKKNTHYRHRFDEIDIIGQTHFDAEDEKKMGYTSPQRSKSNGRDR